VNNPDDEQVTVHNSAYAAAQDSDAIILVTEWDEFIDYDYQRIFLSMRKPAYLFDGRNILDHAKLKTIGFLVEAVGKQI
jgi:UDPglucose 6-dehydrogenase